MKPSTAKSQRRREARAARRRHRLATGRRPRRQVIDVNAAERNGEAMAAPIRKQSQRRQKALDAEAKAKRKARAAGPLPDRSWRPAPKKAHPPRGRSGAGGYAPVPRR